MANIIKHPLFNFIQIEKEEFAPKMNTELQLMYINDMHKQEGFLMFTQMCDYGRRMCIENADYKYWNQCVFEDIDYKFYIEDHNEYINPNILYEQLYEWIYNHYRNVLYYSELSRHMNSFHFIFYFAVERSKNNRLMCKSITNFIIHQAFNALGLKDIIDYPKVFDTCADSFYQPCFITLNEYKINGECTGRDSDKIITDNYYTIKEIYDKLVNKKRKKQTSGNPSNIDWEIEYESNESICYKGPYMNHYERWSLFDYLSGLCGDDDEKLFEEWNKCAEQLPEGNGHSKYFYMNEPYKNHWDKTRDPNHYVDAELLQQFGYNIKFINNSKNENQPKQKINKTRKERIYIS